MDIIEQAMVEAQIASDSGDAGYGKPKPPKPKPKPKPKILWPMVIVHLFGLVAVFTIAFYVGGK